MLQENEEVAQSGRGEVKPGGRDEVEGPGGADPEPPERDRRNVKQSTDRDRGGVEKSEENRGGARSRSSEDRGREGSGSGGHEPGDEHEAKHGGKLEPGAREEGIGGCQGLGVLRGEEKDGDLQIKIHGAGGADQGQGDED